VEEFWEALPIVELQIQELLLWGVGDSRLWLWLSAALHFVVLVNLVAYPIGWLFEKLYNLTYDRR
jgi:hypothetical protein